MRQIAIDGPAGAGKSTIAKEIAGRYGFHYVDTGAMYRVIGLACIREGINTDDEAAVSGICREADINIEYIDNVQHMYLKGEDVSAEIRQEAVGKAASDVSRFLAVRERLVAMQQQLGEKYDVVMDGRDIGTKVLVNADLKIYLTASAECRAERRFNELKAKGEECSLEVILEDIKARDHQDMTRAISPLCKADDAVEVDSTTMGVEEVVGTIIGLFEK